MGTAEVESALVAHESVAEAAVVGFPHEVKGEGIYALRYLERRSRIFRGLEGCLEAAGPRGHRTHRHPGLHPLGSSPSKDSVRQDHAEDFKIVTGETDQIGDASTLADPCRTEPH